MKQIICILDIDPDYSYQFMERINSRRSCPFMVYAFTSGESLMEYLESQRADVVLVSPELYENPMTKKTLATFFLLMDGRERLIPEGVPMIRKYQKADDIIRAILKEYEILTPLYSGEGYRTEIIGVFSPLHRIGKTSFSLALAQELSRTRKVLYLNLEGCSGFSEIFGQEYETDLTDLLYFSRQEPRMMLSQVVSMTQNLHGIDYIPPARVPIELTDIETNEWQTLFDTLASSGLYDYILVDFGESVKGILQLLARCTRILTPTAEDFFSVGKINQYQDMLELLDYTEIIEKSRRLIMPRVNSQAFDGNLTGEVFWSNYSVFARQVAEELFS